MINPSSSGINYSTYRNAIYAGNTSHARLTFENGTVLGDQDIESSGFVLRDVLNGDTNLTFGKAVMKELTIPILNSSRLNGIKWTEEFQFEMGIDITSEGTTTTYWVTVGYFQGQRPEKIHYVEVINFTAYDRMQKLEFPAKNVFDYLDANNAWPATGNDIYVAMCNLAGIDTVTLSSSTYPALYRSFPRGFMNPEGLTCRDLVALMAEAVGCYANVQANGKLHFAWYSDTTLNIDPAIEFSVEAADVNTGMTYGATEAYTNAQLEDYTWADLGGWGIVYGIDGLDVKSTEDDIGVHYGNVVGNLYQIVDNPFLAIYDSTDADIYIKPIWDKLQAFGGHLPVRVECVGNWLVQSGDIVRVKVHPDHDRINVPIYSLELHWNGGPTSAYECTGEIQRPAMSAETKQKLIQGAKYHTFRNDINELYSEVGDTNGNVSVLQQRANSIELSVANKYDRKSGVEIDENGVTITGSSKVDIKSGGSLDVDATNFKISSEEKKVISGKWTFADDGMVFAETVSGNLGNTEFSFGRQADDVDTSKFCSGIYYDYSVMSVGGTLQYNAKIFLMAYNKTRSLTKQILFFHSRCRCLVM